MAVCFDDRPPAVNDRPRCLLCRLPCLWPRIPSPGGSRQEKLLRIRDGVPFLIGVLLGRGTLEGAVIMAPKSSVLHQIGPRRLSWAALYNVETVWTTKTAARLHHSRRGPRHPRSRHRCRRPDAINCAGLWVQCGELPRSAISLIPSSTPLQIMDLLFHAPSTRRRLPCRTCPGSTSTYGKARRCSLPVHRPSLPPHIGSRCRSGFLWHGQTRRRPVRTTTSECSRTTILWTFRVTPLMIHWPPGPP